MHALSNCRTLGQFEDMNKLDPVGSTVRDDEAVYWVSIGHYEAVAVGI